MSHAADSARWNIERVERFLASFNRRWPTEYELAELLAPDVRFVERPNLVSPTGSERDAPALRAGIAAGRQLLSWQTYDVRDHVAEGNTVVTRMHWTGELAVDAGTWPRGTRLSAWCVAHYQFDEHGRIAIIEQYDCYDPPAPPV